MKVFFTATVLLVVITLLQIDSAQSAEVQPTNAPTILPEVTVVGHPESLTSPSPDQAAKQKTQIPGGFSVQGSDDMYQ